MNKRNLLIEAAEMIRDLAEADLKDAVSSLNPDSAPYDRAIKLSEKRTKVVDGLIKLIEAEPK